MVRSGVYPNVSSLSQYDNLSKTDKIPFTEKNEKEINVDTPTLQLKLYSLFFNETKNFPIHHIRGLIHGTMSRI